jgi:hypothetical protein
MSDRIVVRLVRTNVLTRWPCTVCGGTTEKVGVLAEAGTGEDAVRVCENCLLCGDLDHHLEQQAAYLEEEAKRVRKFIGRLQVPTYVEWLRERDRADKDDGFDAAEVRQGHIDHCAYLTTSDYGRAAKMLAAYREAFNITDAELAAAVTKYEAQQARQWDTSDLPF